ncbi:protein retinal degeneration B-like isoform X2 [Limulus polyphemus]|uniref:Protein retinal degeneration B-like isoform X2 n=1 Tax=Limulus polyphemus TaxID=6850 RepID=A0ABM1C5Y0_LIMPO|nr:protein retinal degeneration B-like isoform X2 [Limulus polyphemus]
MLVKEYRIPLPLTVNEYRVAQLYMIAKKSREETRGAGSGVEFLVNKPYVDGPGGSGQYTHKIYHIGSHLPGWLKALLPKSALTVEEEAWNAYPYTKTRYTCPFIEKFYLEIETKYFNDAGHQENVFSLSSAEARSRIIDYIDVVKDQLHGSDYKREEDPKYYVSQCTGRGPLTENWVSEYWEACNGKETPLSDGKAIMCAYKLCRVEFRYWGMQSKIEKFIHDVALRKTMVRAHKQAWVWQDEWVNLTMEDIRQMEKETQELLAKAMSSASGESVGEDNGDTSKPENALHTSPSSLSGQEVDLNVIDKDKDIGVNQDLRTCPSRNRSPSPHKRPSFLASQEVPTSKETYITENSRKKNWSRSSSKSALHSPDGSSIKSFDIQMANWRMESIVRDSGSSSEDEFFDAEDQSQVVSLAKWSSLEMLSSEEGKDSEETVNICDDSIFSSTFIKKVQNGQIGQVRPLGLSAVASSGSLDTYVPSSPFTSPVHQVCPTTALIMVFHSGSVLDTGTDLSSKKSDISTFRSTFESLIRQHYPTLINHIVIRLVSCPAVCSEALAVLSSLSPYSFQSSPSAIDGISHTYDAIPLGSLPLFATSSPDYQENVSRAIATANQTYHEFLKSEEGSGFSGQVFVIGDSMGAVLAYDALCRTSQLNSRYGSESSIAEVEPTHPKSIEVRYRPQSPSYISNRPNPSISIGDGSGNEDGEDVTEVTRSRETAFATSSARAYRKSYSHPQDADSTFYDAVSYTRLLSAPLPRRCSSACSDYSTHNKLDFEVCDFFMFGCPLGMVMAYRKMLSLDDKNIPPPRPSCNQVYNLFHPTDPSAVRIEPLLSARFSQLPPVNVARYQKYPLGDGQPFHLLEYIQSHAHLFTDGGFAVSQCMYSTMGRRTSEASITSTMSGISEAVPLATISTLTQKWWGTKRLDFALYCPEGLANFPTNVLPHLFHASYWESTDVIAFILRQVVRSELLILQGENEKEASVFIPSQPREKWLRKRTSIKIKNVTANHRANDVIVKEGDPQTLIAKFLYGPLDMVSLTGEKIDIHIMKDPHSYEWTFLKTESSDKNGRISYTVPKEKALGYGVFPIKMVVRGDHTSIDFFLAVVPPKTECIVFSIDGSFTASMSVTGRDPKVRAGAVDVVRHWQELGYLIIYITGRPDMQQQRVVSWLSQHNFPHGLVSFAEGLSTDPLRHKAEYLRHLKTDVDMIIHAAYGSSKDIWVYSTVGLLPEQIFIVGKASKKQHSMATVLTDGYAAHLSDLKAPGGSRSAQGNARMILPRGVFVLPGQGVGGLRQRHSAKRTTSYPLSAQITDLRTRAISPKLASTKV